MISKRDLSKQLHTEYCLKFDGIPFEQFYKTIWTNPRDKKSGGFRLTEEGFEVLKTKLDYKAYEIEFPKEDGFMVTNSTIIQIDRYIDCPYFLERKSIWVFKEKMAVQLILFSGDITKYGQSRKSSEKIL
jgi:hypothetical protein